MQKQVVSQVLQTSHTYMCMYIRTYIRILCAFLCVHAYVCVFVHVHMYMFAYVHVDMLREGDELLEVNGIPVTGMRTDEVIRLMVS